ncbi:PIN domain-containing protein [Leadbettera azotonutricia]|uniref:Putative PilT protein domain protein n=1 Tax=Leadbettera azotonutricia (strain ATCC BAA-888 / DSM 13862 / ZAS-9) TaxID=545695 RepID=F5YG76_LEAAZ|nr:PIN domain-containing protein [Leadbettera azotonutricia]AEF81716.1 putative PilT protein domain protein [Leadbettera azotonutricia ZAS-9]
MKQYFVDSNVFLRYFNKDEPKHSAAAADLFKKAKDGKVCLFCGPPVFFEIAWVLRSFYKQANNDILDTLESILSIQGLKIFDIEYVSAAIALAREKNRGFADSYIAVTALNKNMGIATFNGKHFSAFGTELYPLC